MQHKRRKTSRLAVKLYYPLDIITEWHRIAKKLVGNKQQQQKNACPLTGTVSRDFRPFFALKIRPTCRPHMNRQTRFRKLFRFRK